MLCSVGYHLFCCHRSEKTSRRWMALDYAGISIGILGCYVSGVFYAFYCSNVSGEQCPCRAWFLCSHCSFCAARRGFCAGVQREQERGGRDGNWKMSL